MTNLHKTRTAQNFLILKYIVSNFYQKVKIIKTYEKYIPSVLKRIWEADAIANMGGQNSLMDSLDKQLTKMYASTYPLSLEGYGRVGGDGETSQGLGGGVFPRVRVTIQRHRQQHLDTQDNSV